VDQGGDGGGALAAGSPHSGGGGFAAVGLTVTPETLIPGYDGSDAHFQRLRAMLHVLMGGAGTLLGWLAGWLAGWLVSFVGCCCCCCCSDLTIWRR
jgi:hypothetical protein